MLTRRQFVALAPVWGLAIQVLAAAQNSDPQMPPGRISLDDFRKLQAADAVFTIDVRDRLAFREGHIPGAIHVPLDEVGKQTSTIAARAGRRAVVTYCSCPNEHASLAAASLLVAAGLRDVRALTGGLSAWVAQGGLLLRGGLVSQEFSEGRFGFDRDHAPHSIVSEPAQLRARNLELADASGREPDGRQ